VHSYWSIRKLHILVGLRELERQRCAGASSELFPDQIPAAKSLYNEGYVFVKRVGRGRGGKGGGTMASLTPKGRETVTDIVRFLEHKGA
jgi:hypothetical protein